MMFHVIILDEYWILGDYNPNSNSGNHNSKPYGDCRLPVRNSTPRFEISASFPAGFFDVVPVGLWDEASAQRQQAVNITNHKNTNIIKHIYSITSYYIYYIVFLKYHLVQLMQFIYLISSLSLYHSSNSSSTYLNPRFYWALQSSCPLGLVTSAWLVPTKKNSFAGVKFCRYLHCICFFSAHIRAQRNSHDLTCAK